MNKDEIKKALTCCKGQCCSYCPRWCEKGCQYQTLSDALDLITEQEKENDLLKMQLQDAVNHANTFLEEANKFEAENRKLKDEKRNIQVGYTEYALKEDERLEKLRNEIGGNRIMKYSQGQLDLSNVRVDESVAEHKLNRSHWRKGMQAYINEQQQSDAAQNTGWCVCGYMGFCDFCKDSTVNNACVNAIIDMCKEKGITINFARTDYEKQLEEIEK